MRTERGSDALIMMVANKIDLADRRVVTTEEGEIKAKEMDVMFIETSAKAGTNIKTLFRNLAQSLPAVDVSVNSRPMQPNLAEFQLG